MARETSRIRTLDSLASVESFRGSEHVSGKPRVYLSVRGIGEGSMYLTPISARLLAAKLIEHANIADRAGDDDDE